MVCGVILRLARLTSASRVLGRGTEPARMRSMADPKNGIDKNAE